MEFCKLCGKPLKVKKGMAKCSCGFTKETSSDISFKEKQIKEVERGEGVAEDDTNINEGFPNTCKKCGHTKAEVYNLGSQYSDESDIHLYKCKKCKHVERVAEGSSNM